MTDASFEKVSRSDTPLYGPPKLLLCGFPSGAHLKFRTVLGMAGLSDTPVVWVSEERADAPIKDLLGLPDDTGAGSSSGLPRAVIVSGILEAQLHGLMAVCRQAGMKQGLWAVLTPTSETWTVHRLLGELSAEQAALQHRPASP